LKGWFKGTRVGTRVRKGMTRGELKKKEEPTAPWIYHPSLGIISKAGWNFRKD
jgi:hypothetical protein